MQVRRHKFKYQGSVITYAMIGATDSAITVMALHGIGNSLEWWLPTAERLAACSVRVIVVDLPGFGETQVPATKVSVSFAVDSILALSESRSFHCDAVLGHSMGGAVALCLAERTQFPSGVVLVSSAIDEPRFVGHADGVRYDVGAFGNLALQIGLASMPITEGTRRWILRTPLGRWAMRHVVHDVASLPNAAYDAVSRYTGRTLATGAALLSGRKLSVTRIGRVVSSMTRILIINGERDRLSTPRAARSMATQFGCELVILDRCGHWPTVERPDACAEAIASFVSARPRA